MVLERILVERLAIWHSLLNNGKSAAFIFNMHALTSDCQHAYIQYVGHAKCLEKLGSGCVIVAAKVQKPGNDLCRESPSSLCFGLRWCLAMAADAARFSILILQNQLDSLACHRWS